MKDILILTMFMLLHGQWALTQMAPPPLIRWRMRLWIQDPPGACVINQSRKKIMLLQDYNFFFIYLFFNIMLWFGRECQIYTPLQSSIFLLSFFFMFASLLLKITGPLLSRLIQHHSPCPVVLAACIRQRSSYQSRFSLAVL